MIIVEGIDRVGKTTLVNLLKEKTGLPVINDIYVHETKNMRNDMRVNTEKIQTVINFARDVSDKFIADRLHWSEYVYGYVDRRYVNTDAVFKIEEELEMLDAKIILVLPTSIEESSKQHGKDLSKHQETFEKLFENSKMDKFVCDYNDLDKAVEWVVKDEKYSLL